MDDSLPASSVSTDLWSDYWLRQHKNVKASESKIGFEFDPKATRAPSGIVVLPVKITNYSKQAIQATVAHEWHGGEWPPTDLYASATPNKAKESKPFEPVYLAGEDQDATRETKIGPGKSVNVELRMDWPGCRRRSLCELHSDTSASAPMNRLSAAWPSRPNTSAFGPIAR